MQDVKFSNSNEKKLIVGIQNKIGAYANGIIGMQTLTDIAVALDVEGIYPLTEQVYSQPVIVGNDIIVFNPNGPLKNYVNSMTGSFTYPRATTPCSIMINKGQVICGNSCHAHLNKPESVLYKTKDGKFGIKRCVYSSELPKNVEWAVGGMGLGNMYDPAAEGFTGQYADVVRKTDHNVLAVKEGKVYGVLYKNMTGQQIQSHVVNKMKYEMAILLDGGGLAAMNGTESFAKVNVTTKQGYAIQFI